MRPSKYGADGLLLGESISEFAEALPRVIVRERVLVLGLRLRPKLELLSTERNSFGRVSSLLWAASGNVWSIGLLSTKMLRRPAWNFEETQTLPNKRPNKSIFISFPQTSCSIPVFFLLTDSPASIDSNTSQCCPKMKAGCLNGFYLSAEWPCSTPCRTS